MLFHYGHDSLKVPALNFRFLCIEIQKTIKKINADIVDKGNMRPLLAELKDAFKKDPIAQRCLGTILNAFSFQRTQMVKYTKIVRIFLKIRAPRHHLSE